MIIFFIDDFLGKWVLFYIFGKSVYYDIVKKEKLEIV